MQAYFVVELALSMVYLTDLRAPLSIHQARQKKKKRTQKLQSHRSSSEHYL
jgi:hypothetical protein